MNDVAPADFGSAVAGELKVALDPVLTPVLLPRLMSGFVGLHPAVNFSFMEGTPSEVQDWLVQGRCDVVLMYDLGVRDGLHAHPIFSARPKVLVAEDFVGPDVHDIALGSLAAEPTARPSSPTPGNVRQPGAAANRHQ